MVEVIILMEVAFSCLSDLSGSNITDFTIESWIYLPNTSSQYGFFSNQTGDNGANTMRIGTSGGKCHMDENWK